MKSKVRIIMVDPGTTDPTGVVGIEGDLPKNKILVRLAKQITEPIKYKRYRQTRDYLKLLQREIRPTVMGMETNNRGRELITKLKMHGIRLEAITTCGQISLEKSLKGYAMDKPFMVHHTKQSIHDKEIEFPAKGIGDIDELVNQLHSITSIRGIGGAMQYKATRSRHDDLWSAFLLCCYVFYVLKHRWDRYGR